MKKTDIIIFGIGKIAQVVYANIKDDKSSQLNVAAFCVDEKYCNEKEFCSLPVLPFETIEKNFPPDGYKMLIAMGYHDMNNVRAEKCRQAEEKGYKLVSYVHSGADVSSTANIGRNCIILDNVSVEPFAKIGDNVCLYCNSTIAHHSIVHENVWVTSGTVVGGNSTIGKNCFLGINSTIGHNIAIGEYNFIGANALITKSTKDNTVFVLPDTVPHRLDTFQFMKLFKFD